MSGALLSGLEDRKQEGGREEHNVTARDADDTNYFF